jgi:hypothetical protein
VGYAAWLSSAHVANYVLGGCWSLVLDVLSKGKAYLISDGGLWPERR